jgi:ABC-type multidrug transport system ATPase subunit
MDNPTDLLIQTTALTRRFGQETAVDSLNLAVPAGSVYAFLGPNGAGKTTTIRMLLGLIRPTSGLVRLFGRPLNGNRLDVLKRVSALVEAPSLYPNLTGRENLEVTRILLGLEPGSVSRALSLTGLSEAANKLVRAYSLGMRQRLALALALLPEPLLLILDEPTNGLDPAGIHEIRSLIAALPRERGITVFLSSHLLSEVEQVANQVGILQRGQMLFQGPLAELQSRRRSALAVGSPRLDEARRLLEGDGWQVLPSSNGYLRVGLSSGAAVTAADAARANHSLVSAGLPIDHLSLEQPNLEEIFLSITNEVQS